MLGALKPQLIPHLGYRIGHGSTTGFLRGCVTTRPIPRSDVPGVLCMARDSKRSNKKIDIRWALTCLVLCSGCGGATGGNGEGYKNPTWPPPASLAITVPAPPSIPSVCDNC